LMIVISHFSMVKVYFMCVYLHKHLWMYIATMRPQLNSLFFTTYCDHRDLHFSLHDALPIWNRYCLSAVQKWLEVTHNTRSAYPRSEEHTSELQSRENLVCRLLLEKKNINFSISL